MARQRRALADEVAAELRALIADRFAPGDRLPPEQQLAEQFDVSRTTLREAVLALWDEGLVDRKWGAGTFVREYKAPVAVGQGEVSTLPEMIRGAGAEPAIRAFNSHVGAPPAEVAQALGLDADSQAAYLQRTFTADGVPALVICDWLPPTLDGRDFDPTVFGDVDCELVTTLRDDYGCEIVRNEARLLAVAASEELAPLLDVPVGAPLLHAVQAATNRQEEIVIFSHVWYRTDVMDLRLVRTFKSGSHVHIHNVQVDGHQAATGGTSAGQLTVNREVP